MSDTCWCCGTAYPTEELLRLGQHPEVGICTRCAHWLHRRARERRDEQRPTLGASLRGSIRMVREAVIRHRLPDRPVIGPFLRWLDRRLP